MSLEQPPPQRLEQLRLRGLQLPQVSERAADPSTHRDFIDRRVRAVGFGLTVGGYLLYCEGLALPLLVPESQVNLGLTHAQPLNLSIYLHREAALADLAATAPETHPSRFAYYRAASGALLAPTVFSPASTPRAAQAMLEVRQALADSVQREIKVLLLYLTGTKVLQGVFSRVVRLGTGPAPRPRPSEEGLAGKEPAPPPPARSAAPEPAPAPLEPAPAPAATAQAALPRASSSPPAAPTPAPAATAPPPASASAPAVPAPPGTARAPALPPPAPGAVAPSPGLVQALTGRNPTPQVAPGPRLPQDVAVSPKVPRGLPTKRPIGSSATQNAQLKRDIEYLQNIGATNIRVNQQQLTWANGQRVGIKRPDLQFDFNGRRYHVEYDAPSSGRGAAHRSRTTANDPDAEVILLIVQ